MALCSSVVPTEVKIINLEENLMDDRNHESLSLLLPEGSHKR